MFPIYLLEDNSNQRVAFTKVIKNTIMINDLPMELICQTDDPNLLINSITQDHQGLFFLDMELNGQKEAGLDTAILIRHQIPDAQIVFITTHDELSFFTLERKIAPLDYILKERGADYIRQNIIDDLLKVEQLLKSSKYKKENLFNYHVGPHYFSIPLAELLYLTTSKINNSRIVLKALNREADFVGNLNDLSQKYPTLFRCDKSYLVNLNLLDHYDNHKRELHFIDGSIAYASFRKARELTRLLNS